VEDAGYAEYAGDGGIISPYGIASSNITLRQMINVTGITQF
jgi:hypothetical protein